MHSMSDHLHALTLKSKGQRTRSGGYQVRYYATGVGLQVDMTAYVFYTVKISVYPRIFCGEFSVIIITKFWRYVTRFLTYLLT